MRLEASELSLVQRGTHIDHVNYKDCLAFWLEKSKDVLENLHTLSSPAVWRHLMHRTKEVILRIGKHQIERTFEVLQYVVQVVVNDL